MNEEQQQWELRIPDYSDKLGDKRVAQKSQQTFKEELDQQGAQVVQQVHLVRIHHQDEQMRLEQNVTLNEKGLNPNYHKKQKEGKAKEWKEQMKKNKNYIDRETQTHETQHPQK